MSDAPLLSAGQQPGNLDSITLGQLKAIVNTVPKPKQSWYDYTYDDEDTVMNEIDELYSYVEMPQVNENLKAWKGSFAGDWTKSTLQKRKGHVDLLLEGLEHKDAVIRFVNARRLFYIVQGTFAETVSPEHQLHWIYENCKVVRSANGVGTILEALKIASAKHDFLWSLGDEDIEKLRILPTERSNLIEEFITEISVYFGMLYHLMEVFKGHDDFADELMSLDPPLPVYFFNMMANLKDKSAKGYPVKKLLLLLWKSILVCCGGVRELARVKKLSRELYGFSPEETNPEIANSTIKASPFDIEQFRQETSNKYPTFSPAQPPAESVPIKATTPAAPTAKLAQAYSPIPVRHHYHHDIPDPHTGLPQSMPQHFYSQQQQQQHFRGIPQPATPAPSPPLGGPKQKKEKYQTDQTRPFLFPFSPGTYRNGRLIPFAIDEADNLYSRHMHISLSLVQMWRTREDCMTFESGLEHMPGAEGEFEPSTIKMDPQTAEPLPDITVLDAKIAEVEEALSTTDSGGEKRRLKELREDLTRLKRVEQIYSAILPFLSGWVPVILKLLLATVSAGSNMQQNNPNNPMFNGSMSSPQNEQPPQPQSLDEIDVIRHREINCKAASAIILLTLRWFKVSHVMKFHHLGQQLLDNNCLLLIMKMFGLNEVTTSVISKADSPDNNFFRYCQLNFSRSPPPPLRPEDDLKPTRHFVTKSRILPNGEEHTEEVEMVTEFSWRNFFSTINFAKISQKLSKHRAHRVIMLVQYKSSAVLKRMLRVQHPLLQLQLLKLLKSQVPFCGKKWRQSNMKVITSIYLNCRPDLRDEWLTGNEAEDAVEALAQENALRHLVKFYNTKRYGPNAAASWPHNPPHRRTGSISSPMDGLQTGPDPSGPPMRTMGTPNIVPADVFPPVRAQAPDNSIFLPYITEDITFEEEYEEYLSDLGWSNEETNAASAWHRLQPDFNPGDISDSESIDPIGDLGEDGRLDVPRDETNENLNNWEHMSPKTMAALPRSPAGHRRSSSGGGLRPVVPFGLDSGVVDPEDEEEMELGPVPRENSEPFAEGAGVDEVEYAYGV